MGIHIVVVWRLAKTLCHYSLTVVMPVLTGVALVDCSASSETIGLLSQVVNLDGCVVLANKKPLTSSQVP